MHAVRARAERIEDGAAGGMGPGQQVLEGSVRSWEFSLVALDCPWRHKAEDSILQPLQLLPSPALSTPHPGTLSNPIFFLFF